MYTGTNTIITIEELIYKNKTFLSIVSTNINQRIDDLSRIRFFFFRLRKSYTIYFG